MLDDQPRASAGGRSPGPAANAWRLSALAIAVTAWAVVPAIASPVVGLASAAALSVLLGLGMGWWCRDARLALLAALLPASVLVGSMLLPVDARYLPIATVAIALATATAEGVRKGRILVARPGAALSVVLLLYVAWAAVTSVVSTDRPTSLIYLAGMIGTLLLAFVLIPSSDEAPRVRVSLMASAAATGVALAAAAVVVAVVGPLPLFGRLVGLDLIGEISLGGRATGLIVPRITGIFQQPADQSFGLAIGLVALVALVPRAKGRWLATIVAGIALTMGALLLTMTRDGWLAALVGATVFAAGSGWAGRRSLVADGLAVALVLALGGLLVGAVGVDARYDVALQRYGLADTMLLPGNPYVPDAVPEEDQQLRGGAGLSGRPQIWTASLAAIRARPIAGSGLGTNPAAIAPYLQGHAAIYRGLTSHDTWLRTAVELGIPGLLLLCASIVMVLWSLAWGAPEPGGAPEARGSGPGWLGRMVARARAVAADLLQLASVSTFLGLTVAATFETLLFGGLNYPSFMWAVLAGVLTVWQAPGAQAILDPAGPAPAGREGGRPPATRDSRTVPLG